MSELSLASLSRVGRMKMRYKLPVLWHAPIATDMKRLDYLRGLAKGRRLALGIVPIEKRGQHD